MAIVDKYPTRAFCWIATTNQAATITFRIDYRIATA
jgi:hypothetical protein